jgi:hypothetical protein
MQEWARREEMEVLCMVHAPVHVCEQSRGQKHPNDRWGVGRRRNKGKKTVLRRGNQRRAKSRDKRRHPPYGRGWGVS